MLLVGFGFVHLRIQKFCRTQDFSFLGVFDPGVVTSDKSKVPLSLHSVSSNSQDKFLKEEHEKHC